MSETPESSEPTVTKPTPTTSTRPSAASRRAAAAASEASPTEPIAPGPVAAAPGVGAQPARRSSLPVVAAVVAAALIGGVSGAGVSLWAVSQDDDKSTISTTTPDTVVVNDPDNATSITAVAVKASPSVVTISVTSGQSGGTGSGVVINDEGYILTNAHVVTLEGAADDPTVRVQTSDGKLLDAKIVGTDPIADLAVIKVDAASNLDPITFADSSKLNVGDTAIAIGAPLGLSGSVTDGIISSLNRSISIASSAAPDTEEEGDGGSGQSPFDFWGFGTPDQNSSRSTATISLAVIQTDASINPGNSGGALLDSDGNLIGINVAIASAGNSSGQSGSIGVGFAIPSNMAKRIAEEIIDTGSATHGLLGASVLDVTEDETANSDTVGASIAEVVSGGAADEAGLRAGDVITAVNGIRITGKTDLTAQVRAFAAGETVKMTYVRNGEADEVSVTLGELQP